MKVYVVIGTEYLDGEFTLYDIFRNYEDAVGKLRELAKNAFIRNGIPDEEMMFHYFPDGRLKAISESDYDDSNYDWLVRFAIIEKELK